MTLLFDIEANGLQDEADTIWCIVTYDTDRGDYRVYTDFKGSLTPNGTIQEGIHELTQSDIICAHNAIGYDAPLLRRISPLFTAQFAGKIEDTYVLTQLFYPDTMPTASIEAWGRKFGLPKPGHEDWSKCSDEMIQRCLMDVKILKRVWETCQQERQSWDWEKAIALEYETYRTLVDSGQYWPINKDALDHLVEKATGEAGEALESLKKMHGGYVSGHPSNPFGEPLKPVKLHKKTYEVEDQIIAFAKDGSEWSDLGYSSLEEKGYTLTQFSYDSDWNWHSPRRGLFIKYASKSTLGITKAAQDWINKVYGPLSEHKIPTTVVGDFSRLYYHDFNPGSPPQVKDWLFSLGWKPVMKTAKGDWSTSNDPLLGIPHKEKEAFQRVKKLNKVVSAYANGLPRVAKEVNGVLSIPFSAKVCGTVTGRWTHKNLVNIPRVSSFYGKEIRSVFTHRPGYKLIGCDASALEAMLEAYEVKDIDNGARLYDVQNTDCHQKFADMAGVDRDTAKAACVPMHSQILTRQGWKSYNEVIIGEEVLAYDEDTGTKRWTPLLAKQSFVDDVIELSNRSWTLQATKDHRWFVRQRRMGSKAWTKINGRYMDPQVRTTDELNKESNIIINAPMHHEEDLSSRTQGLAPTKYDEDWIQRVLNMSQTERLSFLEGFLIADGHCRVDSGGIKWSWDQNKGAIADAALLASYLATDGAVYVTDRNNSSKPMSTGRINTKSHITCQKLTKTSLGKQQVWCPTTKYGSWVMKQGNHITITGNSYALAYGAGPFKVSTMLNCSEEEAQNLFKSYHEMRWELKDYQNQLKEFLRDNKFIVKKKFKEHLKDGAYIPGIDGRKLYIRAMHKIHNSYIQSTGAILMKRAYNKLAKLIKINKLDARVIILYHDEYQIEVKDDPSTMNKVGKLAIACIEEASRFYGFPGLIKGEAKIGSNWAETH